MELPWDLGDASNLGNTAQTCCFSFGGKKLGFPIVGPARLLDLSDGEDVGARNIASFGEVPTLSPFTHHFFLPVSWCVGIWYFHPTWLATLDITSNILEENVAQDNTDTDKKAVLVSQTPMVLRILEPFE